MRQGWRRLVIVLLISQCFVGIIGQAAVTAESSSAMSSSVVSNEPDEKQESSEDNSADVSELSQSGVSSESIANDEEKPQTPTTMADTATSTTDTTVVAGPQVEATQSVVATDYNGQELVQGLTVTGGKFVQYKFKLNWITGATLEKPQFCFWPSSNTHVTKSAQLEQANGKKGSLKLNGDHYDLPLQVQLNAQNPWVSVTVMVETKPVDKGKTQIVQGGEAYFEYSRARHKFALPEFMLVEWHPLEGSVEQQEFRVQQDGRIVIKGKFWRKGGLQTKKVWLKITRNGKELSKVAIDPMTAENGFEHVIEAADLGPGKHELYLHAKDNHNLAIQPIRLTVIVQGELKFEKVSAKAKFESVTVTGESQVASRQSDWHLKVADTREAASNWVLTASVSELVDKDQNQKLAGGLVHQEQGKTLMLDATDVVIARGQAMQHQPIHDVAGGWTTDSGVLLKTRPDAVPGNYQGTITWRLADVPPTE
ncbi:hypothetical protein ACFP1L_03465 [Lactiplantibacillus nangangensis]|uniref:WxL domain-containing protein n=1 Tax=Lactiplantibacillus nangangensis TaxID=2559917 RepID=A0ABW1SHB4_9LACO|nr:hypothetical protein [Lactiplantibacillus nangangensis]